METYKLLSVASKISNLFCSNYEIARIIDTLNEYQYSLDDMLDMLNDDKIVIWATWEDLIEDTLVARGIKITQEEIKNNLQTYIELLRRSDRFFAISTDLSDPKAQVLEIR